MPTRTMVHPDDLAAAYLDVKELLIQWGFSREIDWQFDRHSSEVNDEVFLAEYAWVVLSCGISERVVHHTFPRISAAFCAWRVEHIAMRGLYACADDAMVVFKSAQKIGAIAQVAGEFVMGRTSAHAILRSDDPLSALRRLPFIGPVSVFHFAKNLGLNACKPDRHLVRLAKEFAYPDARMLCETIVRITGDVLAVVDIVLWRYLAETLDYSLQPAVQADIVVSSRMPSLMCS